MRARKDPHAGSRYDNQVTPQPIFTRELTFTPDTAADVLREIPPAAGVVSLFGHNSTDRPHLLQSANLRRRLQRLLLPDETKSKRLNLRDRIARIAWHPTHSNLESLLLLHRAMSVVYGTDEARKKLRLTPPFTIRYAAENRFPRIYVTNHLRRRSLGTTFGPFASRLDADRYREAVEDLFLIRRCFLELHPSPDDPGCIYGEMHKCQAPCQARVTDEEYRAEAERTLAFLQTRGASLMADLEAERDTFSADMLFEEAAATHTRITKTKAVADIADRLIAPLDSLRALLLIPCPGAKPEDEPQIQLFLFAEGCLRGPHTISLLGVRLAREQAEVGSSLFAQPMMLAAVPLHEPGLVSAVSAIPDTPAFSTTQKPPASQDTTASAEERLLAAIALLEATPGTDDPAVLGDHLAILRRWYYRPEKQREGALFLQEKNAWPARKIIRAAAKLLTPAPPPPRESTPTPHPGREDLVTPTQ